MFPSLIYLLRVTCCSDAPLDRNWRQLLNKLTTLKFSDCLFYFVLDGKLYERGVSGVCAYSWASKREGWVGNARNNIMCNIGGVRLLVFGFSGKAFYPHFISTICPHPPRFLASLSQILPFNDIITQHYVPLTKWHCSLSFINFVILARPHNRCLTRVECHSTHLI